MTDDNTLNDYNLEKKCMYPKNSYQDNYEVIPTISYDCPNCKHLINIPVKYYNVPHKCPYCDSTHVFSTMIRKG